MNFLFRIKEKEISDIDTTILHTSSFNYNEDILELINHKCEVITNNSIVDINTIPLKLIEEFNCQDLLKKGKLTKIDELTINVLSSLKSDKNIIVFFHVLMFLESERKKQIIKRLKEQGKRIINYTSEIEETCYLDYIMVVHQNKIIMEGKTKYVLLEEKILKKLGFSLPFIVELSNGLKYYNLIEKIYFDSESLVNELWK